MVYEAAGSVWVTLGRVSRTRQKGSLTDSEIQTGVEAMLASGALASGGASAVAAIGAQKVDTTTVDVVFA